MTKGLVLALALAMLTACGQSTKSEIKPIYSERMNEKQLQQAKLDYRTLKEECPNHFGRYAEDIETIDVKLIQYPADCGWHYKCEDHGWQYETEVLIHLKAQTKSIPKNYKASGHTMYYYINTGATKPGVINKKAFISNMICDWPTTTPSGHDGFYPL